MVRHLTRHDHETASSKTVAERVCRLTSHEHFENYRPALPHPWPLPLYSLLDRRIPVQLDNGIGIARGHCSNAYLWPLVLGRDGDFSKPHFLRPIFWWRGKTPFAFANLISHSPFCSPFRIRAKSPASYTTATTTTTKARWFLR